MFALLIECDFTKSNKYIDYLQKLTEICETQTPNENIFRLYSDKDNCIKPNDFHIGDMKYAMTTIAEQNPETLFIYAGGRSHFDNSKSVMENRADEYSDVDSMEVKEEIKEAGSLFGDLDFYEMLKCIMPNNCQVKIITDTLWVKFSFILNNLYSSIFKEWTKVASNTPYFQNVLMLDHTEFLEEYDTCLFINDILEIFNEFMAFNSGENLSDKLFSLNYTNSIFYE